MASWIDDLILAGKADRAIALRFPGGEVSYGRLRELVDEQDRRLSAGGTVDSHVVAIQVPPSVAYVGVTLACLRAGAQVLLLDHRLTAVERDACLRGRQCAVRVSAAGTSKVTTFVAERETDLVRESGAGPAPTPHRLVQFSSGSTGQPKVIGRTAACLVAELDRFGGIPGWFEQDDVVLVLNSLAHSFGLIGALLSTLRVGGTVAFAASPLPRDLGAATGSSRPTVITGVPAHFALLATMDKGVLGGVRASVSGGELMAPQTYSQFADRHGHTVGQAYGLTEVGIVAADVSGAEAPAVGWVLPGMSVDVRDDEVMVAVTESPYLTDEGGERVRDGWLHTGDRGVLDADAKLTLLGRRDALVVIGGLKVDLTEVEGVLRAAPGVGGAVVFADGDTVEAHVEGNATADALHRWCAQRLAPVKRPRRITVVGALPRTATGKLLRRPDQRHTDDDSAGMP